MLFSVMSWSCTDTSTQSPALTASNAPSPTATGRPSPSPTPTLPPSPTPSPTPTPLPELAPGDAVVVGGTVRTRSKPSSASEQVGTLEDLERVTVVEKVQGENWLVGSQTWLASLPSWASAWFRLEDGSYVYGPFVFILDEGEVSPLASATEGSEKWIDVDLSEQIARAMVGEEAVFTAAISSGAPPFETPTGTLAIEPDGRIAVERMTATQAGYESDQARYDVERVLFTQYSIVQAMPSISITGVRTPCLVIAGRVTDA